MTAAQIVVQRVDSDEDRRRELASGLLARPAHIAPKFFYDPQGCALYEAIVALDEYYPPRAEAAIFEREAATIAAQLPRGAQFVDLGCGDGLKARRWFDLLAVQRYVGVDIAEPWLRQTLQRAAKAFPQIRFGGVVTDFTRGLDLQGVLDTRMPTLFFYPGSSIGNFEPSQAVRLLREIRSHLQDGDRLLIGADTPKERAVLEAAYDDAPGVTAAFNRNVLRVANRLLGADFDLRAFAHRAVYNESRQRIEMHLVAQRDMVVRLGAHGTRRFETGEAIVTEHSYKYRPAQFAELLQEAGFGRVQRWTDERGCFAVYVAAPEASA
jgi:dimethylhistidine N-methyltransferase